jgi:hypothetical protein
MAGGITMAAILGQTKRGLAICVLIACTCILTAPAPAADTITYQYQTHRTFQTLSGPRDQHVAAKLGDGKVGILGGFDISSVEIFDPNAETFTTLRANRLFDNLCGISLLDGNALLVDGSHDCTFDYVTGEFVNTANAYSAGVIRWAVPVRLPDGKVFLCGGCDANYNVTTACVLYDPRARQFTSCGRLQVARARHTAVLLDEDHVLVIGGYNISPTTLDMQSLDSLEVFDLKTRTSSLVRTTLKAPRYNHCSVKLADGRVLNLGGANWPKDLFMTSTEIFDPRTAVMTDGPQFSVGRQGARTAVMPSGRIAIFGGQYATQTIEIYDPNTSTLSVADCRMADPRWTDFTATTLNSGAVLIAGGRVDNTGLTTQYAEIFEEVAVTAPKSK